MKLGWTVEEVDILRGQQHDLARASNRSKLQARIQACSYQALIGSPPCNTMSRVKFANKLGPQPTRSAEHRLGFPWITGERARLNRVGSLLADFALDSMLDMAELKGVGLLEFPEDLGCVQHGSWKGTRPASLWQWPQMNKIREDPSFREVGVLQKDFGTPYLKPTRLLMLNVDVLPTGPSVFHGPPTFATDGTYMGPIPRTSTLGLQTLVRKTHDTNFPTTGTAAWPWRMSKWIADVIHTAWASGVAGARIVRRKEDATVEMKQKEMAPPFDTTSQGPSSKRDVPNTSHPVTTSASMNSSPPKLERPFQGDHWRGGFGPTRSTVVLGRVKPFHDGAGLLSPGRWPPERRIYPMGSRWVELRHSLLNLLIKNEEKGVAWGLPGVERALLRLCCSPKTDVFSADLIQKGRKLIRQWNSRQCGDYDLDEPQIAKGQPFLLQDAFHILREMKDVDFEFMNEMKGGTTAGILEEMPRVPELFEEQVRWKLKSDPFIDPLCFAENYKSLADHVEEIQLQFEEEQEDEMMEEMSDEEFLRRYPKPEERAISSLAVVVEDNGNKLRVLLDATNNTRVNFRIKQRDKLRNPGVPEKHCQMRERMQKGEIPISLLGDVSKAHRRCKVKATEHGFLACKLKPNKTWINKVGCFGVASAAYFWGRLMGCFIRLCHGIVGAEWTLEVLVYADDLEWTAANRSERIGVVLMVFLLLVMGTPMKWSKFRGGFVVNWIGLQIDNRNFAVGLSEQRTAWTINWLNTTRSKGLVNSREMAGGVGRLNFAASALVYEKPWLGPLYGWTASILAEELDLARIPWGILFIMFWIQKRLTEGRRMSKVPMLFRKKGVMFKSDAKATSTTATIGGWSCRDGLKAKDAPWFAVDLTPTSAPWAFAKKDPKRVIAALELYGTLLCLVLFCEVENTPTGGTMVLTGTTDNQGNTYALKKLMSTKFPLAPLLVELSEQMRKRHIELDLIWERRDRNVEADDLTNGVFDKFDEKRRLIVDVTELKWEVLDEMMAASQQIYDEAAARKLVRKQGSTQRLRKRIRPEERMKVRDPW